MRRPLYIPHRMPAARSSPMAIVALGTAAALTAAATAVGTHLALRALARRRYRRGLPAQRRRPRAEPLNARELLVRNPIVEVGQDPWIARVDDDPAGAPFHYLYSDNAERLALKRAPDLFDFDAVAPYWTWDPRDHAATAHLKLIWAPELHRIDGRWVIYVAMKPTANVLAPSHRMHAFTAVDDADLARGFAYAGELALPGNAWAIDGTPLRHAGKLYHVWSGWAPGERLHQYLYICAMRDALTPTGPRVRISAPTYPWELRGRRLGLWPKINEGPVQLDRAGRTFLVYSASGSWSDYYTLGLLELTGSDPLDPAAWTKHPEPVLAPNDEVIAPGHNGFVERAGQLLCVYHAAQYSRAGWEREVHVAPMGFTARGWPLFPEPRRAVVLARG